MSKTLDQILGYTQMTGVISNPAGGIPDTGLDPAWLNTTEPIDGDTAQWTNVYGERAAATIVSRESPARQVNKKGLGITTAKCITSFESVAHKMNLIAALRNLNDPAAQQRAEQIVDAQTVEFRRRFENLRKSAVYSMLRYGAVYFDGDGNLLSSSSGAVVSVDFKIPAGQQGTCGGLVSADWDVAGTSITQQLINIRKAAAQLGVKLTTAYYGSAIRDYFLGNTAIKAMMTSDSALSSALRQGTIPSFCELEWKPIYDASTEIAGTMTDWFPEDYVILTATPTREWYAIQEGSFEMPMDNTIGADANDMLSGFKTVYGMGSYAERSTNPPGIVHYAFDTFLPALKNPAYVWILNTVA